MNTTASIPRAYPAFRFLACLLVTCLCASATAGIVYVNKNAPGPAHDGTNWSTAFLTVQAGIDASVNGDEVWVAKSWPAATAYVENVTLKNGVSLYGGFAGVETERGQRDVTANATVLSSPSTSSIAVKADVIQTTIDGFTVRNGMDGVAVTSGTVTVANCTISGNQTGVYGDGTATVTNCSISDNTTYGISMPFGTATVTNCTISDNGYDGLALYQGTATVSHCVISGNDNGVYVNYSSAIVSNCTITGNSADGVGLYSGTATVSNCNISKNSDGVYVFVGTATVSNCTISGNRDGVYVEYDTATLANCTVTGNGTGVYVSDKATVSNCIVAFNGTGIFRYDTSDTVTLSYNDVYGNTTNYSNVPDPTGTNGNISVDPLLSNPYHDIHIQPGSPCRDAGNDTVVQSGWVDIDGQPRIQGTHVDIGSDESDGTTWTVPGRTWYVQPTGDDLNNGLSWATAKKTVKGALAAANGPDEVWVAEGVYLENITIPAGVALFGGFSGTESALGQRNWSANVTVLARTGNDVVTPLHNAVLDGFTVRSGRDGVHVYGAATVSNCNITGNTSDGVYVESGTATVTNCTISGNNDGVFVYRGSATVSNCTISGNPSYGVYAQASGTTVSNCIVAFNGTGIRRTSTTYTVTLSYNDVYGNATSNYSNITDPIGTNGNISVDPLLSNAYHDIHIQPGSPCRDAGNDTVVQPGWADIDRQPRIQGTHVDIGSDESDGTTWTVPVHTWYVKPTGDDLNNGLSWATAKKTVTGALSAAGGPDEVWVAGGVYQENITIPAGVALFGGFNGTETALSERNWSTNITVLDGFGNNVVTPFPGAVLDGFTVRNGRDGVSVYGTATVSNCNITGNSSGGVNLYNSTVIVSNCTIRGNGNGVIVHGDVATVSNCIITGNGDGVLVPGGTVIVSNCTISGNRDGFRVEGGRAIVSNCTISGNSNGVNVQRGTAMVSNCTISGNPTYGVSAQAKGTKVSNCIVAFNGTGIQRSSTSYTMTLSYNDVYANTTANYTNITDPTGMNGNISVDPLFVNRDNNNYRLATGSPCIDAGDDSLITAGMTDLDGNPRNQGARVDMGAYEYPAGTGYRWWDVVRVLTISGGMAQATLGDIAHLNPETSDGGITVRDAVRIARKAAGMDANP